MLQAELLLLPTMLCKKIAVLCSNWYKNQVASAAPVPVPDFTTIFDDIDNERPWQPIMSASFLSALGLASFHTPRQYRTLPQTTNPPTNAPAPTPAPAPAPAPPPSQERLNNLSFNANLFQTYKDSPTTCRVLRTKIRNNELPPLPPSKVDNQPMCIAWHCKGMCNNNCGRKADHVAYTDTEYAPLVTWCRTNFSLQ